MRSFGRGWVSLVVVVVVVTVVRTSKIMQNTVLLKDKVLPPSVHTFSIPVSNRCECRMICFVSQECQFASVQQETSGLVCYGTNDEKVYPSLVQAPGDYTFFWSAYRHIGLNYYRLYTTGLDWYTASMRCKEEAGQLVVADTPNKRGELDTFVKDNGITKVWIGLFFTLGELGLGVDPTWQSNNGGVVREVPGFLNEDHQCFYYVFYEKEYHTSNAYNACEDSLSYVCQREW